MTTTADSRRRPRGRLRRRLLVGFVALSLSTAALAGVALWFADTYIEDAAVRDLMEREMANRTVPRTTQDHLTGERGALRFFTAADAPVELRGHAPGYEEDFELGERTYNLLVRDTADGPVYLLYDISFVEERENILAWMAALALSAVTITSIFAARWLARRALAPLDLLVDQLAQLDPERRGERIALPADDSELAVIVDAINAYMEQLDVLVERERSFAASASHELRTPIAVIQGAAETLALQGENAPLKRIARAVAIARHELDALLALSRVRERPALASVRLDTWLQELAATYAEAIPNARIVWDIDAAEAVVTAPGAIAAIFTNLLRNALRASAGAPVHVYVRPTEIVVTDRGPGIAAADLPHIFEPGFRRLDGGSGMGLYIARTLAARFGWQLSLRNDEPHGVVAALRFGEVDH
ncbi:sensor histidine kinase [Solimonas marina]|uniref:histidine kinase n=1 Tax=Solimonas marina TaxID=2714601 RepID=A0A970B522_9GAMM|nr:HAMP domain-containing sensor histidine kinase [Solimonas marina]NKF21233.1 HAMP domain-containing histidine kinase [Solimonas marina]